MLSILTSIWVLPSPNAGQYLLFQWFLGKKMKNEEKEI